MKIIVTDLKGVKHDVEAVAGWRVMEILRDSGFSIKAECGGACACATCHVYVAENWLDKIPPMRGEEDYMLDEAMGRRENSRLSCQIIMDEELDGLELTIGKNPD
jgi:2Fe-2S ferredoxin